MNKETFLMQKDFLNFYPTSASFMLFLYEKSTKDDFQRAILDVSLLPEIYGKDFDGLVEEWLVFLGFDVTSAE